MGEKNNRKRNHRQKRMETRKRSAKQSLFLGRYGSNWALSQMDFLVLLFACFFD
jgi:hypothetical protein